MTGSSWPLLVGRVDWKGWVILPSKKQPEAHFQKNCDNLLLRTILLWTEIFVVLSSCDNGSRQKKTDILRSGWPEGLTPPLQSGVLWFFWGVHLTLIYIDLWLYMRWNNFWQKIKFFDPLFDPLAEWRWALQIVANTTMKPRRLGWELY